MNEADVKRYAAIADKKERDPYGPDGGGRATVVNGRGFQKWRRFNKGAKTVWVENAQGQRYELTPNQFTIFRFASSHFGTYIPMRSIAAQMKLSPSTISRALVKLASFGLIAYLTGRGRYAATVMIERVKDDGMDRFRRAAKEKVRSWRLAAEKRLSRLQFNVAPYFLERKEVGKDSLYGYLETLLTKDATLTTWTPDDLREAGII